NEPAVSARSNLHPSRVRERHSSTPCSVPTPFVCCMASLILERSRSSRPCCHPRTPRRACSHQSNIVTLPAPSLVWDYWRQLFCEDVSVPE
ncbi:hypothetical protein SCLCIDRAFT_1222751, partial [Scleroderma citrinum Foug A]